MPKISQALGDAGTRIEAFELNDPYFINILTILEQGRQEVLQKGSYSTANDIYLKKKTKLSFINLIKQEEKFIFYLFIIFVLVLCFKTTQIGIAYMTYQIH